MRKLEEQMNSAIRGQRNWAGSNTTVMSDDNGLVSRVYLHGNHIATYSHTDRSLTLLDGGWQSVTTKSRLNALCSEFKPAFGVFQKKTYYWDQSGNSLTNWNPGQKIMNTKVVNPVYEAGHCLYASCLEIIDNGFWMDENIPPKPKLFKLSELECFDIDYEWQFNICEKIYSTTNI